MTNVLKKTIQIFWAMIGFFAAWLMVESSWRILSGRAPNGALEWIVGLPMLALFGVFLFGAWRALFRFAPDTVQNTVFLISLFLFSIAERGTRTWFVATPSTGGSDHPLLGLLTILIVVAGAFKYCRVTSATLVHYLFPGLRQSGIRAL